MTLRTLPVFYYGFEVTPECTWVDFREGEFGLEISFELPVGVYSAEELRAVLQENLRIFGTLLYTVTFDRFTRKFAIHTDDYFELLVGSGTNKDSSMLKCMGFSSYPVWGEDNLYGGPLLLYGDVDTGLFTIHYAKFPAFFKFEPQFKVQSYEDAENNESLRTPAVQEDSAGNVEVLHFGLDKFYEFNFKYITDRVIPCGAPIRNDQNAVASANSFMKWCIRRKKLEYMPDKSNPNIYHEARFEKGPKSGTSGTGYRLKENTSQNLPEFFETGKLVFRRLE